MTVDFYNPRSLVCFVAILQGLIFAGMLLLRYSRGKQKADFWLAALLLVLCSALITPLIGFANVYDLNQWLTYFPFSIAYSYGVCVWFYTLNLTDSNRRFRFTDWLLFVPTIVYVSFRLYLFAHDLEWKGWFGKNYGGMMSAIVFVTEFVWNFMLLYLSIGTTRSTGHGSTTIFLTRKELNSIGCETFCISLPPFWRSARFLISLTVLSSNSVISSSSILS
jgi:hypothetical protein